MTRSILILDLLVLYDFEELVPDPLLTSRTHYFSFSQNPGNRQEKVPGTFWLEYCEEIAVDLSCKKSFG